jgi:hypothetical protein
MQRERRLTKGETPEAPTKKLSTIVPQDASPDTAVQLSRIETILDRILRNLAPLAGAR